MRMLLFVGVGLVGCSGAVVCTEIAIAGIRLRVTDEHGAPVCDATVTATDGGFSAPLEEQNCAYVGAWERIGTYVIDVTRKDYKPARLSDVTVVNADECHVRTADVVASISPE